MCIQSKGKNDRGKTVIEMVQVGCISTLVFRSTIGMEHVNKSQTKGESFSEIQKITCISTLEFFCRMG